MTIRIDDQLVGLLKLRNGSVLLLDDTLPLEVAEIVRDIFHNKQAVTEVFKELLAVAENDIASIVKYIQHDVC